MIDKKFNIIAAIADVHIGNKSISWKEYKYQLKKGVIEKLQSLCFLDMIVLCGDTLHCQISMNSEYAEVFFWFIDKLVKIAKDKKCAIRIIKGTKSHDLSQLDTIKFYENEKSIDFKIIDDYLIEDYNGMRLCYIAQNYIDKTIEEYYSEIFNDKFDIMFGHMTIEQTQFVEQNSENFDTHTPVFNLKKLYNISNLIVSGHIHTPMVFNNKFFYVGSVLRTAHGEEDPKGWDLITYLPNEKIYRLDKIINEYTFNFNTLELNDDFIESSDIECIVKKVEAFMSKNNTDKLMLKITCIDKEETTVKIEMLKKYFDKNTNITLKLKILSEKSYQEEIKQNKRKEVEPYLADGLDIVQRIKIWALLKRNVRLSDDDIRKYIVPKLLKREGV